MGFDSTALVGLPEFSLYVAIKMDVYGRAARSSTEGAHAGAQTDFLFTAHSIHKSLSPRHRSASREAWRFTDFYDISASFIRERLKRLNHGTALQEHGRGVRNSMRYRWKEPVQAGPLDAYRRLRSLLGPNLPLALDLYRIWESFGWEPFQERDVLEVFRGHRARFVDRRWYRISTGTGPTSIEFTDLVMQRFRRLVESGAVVRGAQGFQLSARGEEAVQWFELFAFSATYGPHRRRRARPSTRFDRVHALPRIASS